MDVKLDRELRHAITERRTVRFVLKDCVRIVEPHDYGVKNGITRLLCYQIGGQSRSGRPTGWRWANLAEISKFEILDATFDGPRPAPSGQHTQWDELFASVSRQPTNSRARRRT